MAQALSPMPFVMQLGIGVAKTPVFTGMVLNCNGNAITLSSKLREEGVDNGDSLRRYIKQGYRTRKLVLGVALDTHRTTLSFAVGSSRTGSSHMRTS